MVFLISKLAWDVLSPSVLLLLLSWFGLGLIWTRHLRWGYRLLVAGLSGYLLILLLPINVFLSLPLEDRFPRPTELSRVDGIVVLSGAIEPELSSDRGIVSLNGAAERMTETVALARRYPMARIVFTGGNAEVYPGGPAEARWAQPLFSALGVDPARITYESASRNTYENVVNVWHLVHPAASDRWLLITSASHMPRAIGVFRRIGWNVTAWPVAYKAGHSMRAWIEPSMGQKISYLNSAAHEWLGLLAYRVMDRTDALFPKPAP